MLWAGYDKEVRELLKHLIFISKNAHHESGEGYIFRVFIVCRKGELVGGADRLNSSKSSPPHIYRGQVMDACNGVGCFAAEALLLTLAAKIGPQDILVVFPLSSESPSQWS